MGEVLTDILTHTNTSFPKLGVTHAAVEADATMEVALFV